MTGSVVVFLTWLEWILDGRQSERPSFLNDHTPFMDRRSRRRRSGVANQAQPPGAAPNARGTQQPGYAPPNLQPQAANRNGRQPRRNNAQAGAAPGGEPPG
ncbi:hypothetical protein B0A48_01276 [Cryoendolithus antarcticus]|uniref:Uncharacterized protein n=1 Tax=Cryoendolithus antarcticus TaxID=1507870 RepID=A0A1V8TSR5_9PEZI|nr:hypothetical protein B0A48_01276 [Cryoendolithus antarcticus]